MKDPQTSYEEHRRQMAAEADPYVMYLVVQRNPQLSVHDALRRGAQAAVLCGERFSEDPEYSEHYQQWLAQSFRKVTLRARGGLWAQAQELPHTCAGDPSDGGVLCLPPRPRGEYPQFTRKLQAYAASPVDMPLGVEYDVPQAMLLVLNSEHSMSIGKSMAQAAHAAMIMAADPRCRDDADAYALWRMARYPILVRAASGSAWEQLKDLREEHGGALVQDAGVTEVAPGSETFMAFSPGKASRDVIDHTSPLGWDR